MAVVDLTNIKGVHTNGDHDDISDSTAIVAYELGDDEVASTGMQFF